MLLMNLLALFLGIIFALLAVGALTVIALFWICDRAEEQERNDER